MICCQPGFLLHGCRSRRARERRCSNGDVPALRASWRIYADAVERDQGWRTFCSSTAGPGCAGPLRRDPAVRRSRSQGRSSHRSTAAANLPRPHQLLGGSTPFTYAQPSAQLSQSGSASVDRHIADWTYVPHPISESDVPYAPHSGQGTSGSARTNNPNGVPAGRPRPADSTPQSSNRGAQNMRLHSARWQAAAVIRRLMCD